MSYSSYKCFLLIIFFFQKHKQLESQSKLQLERLTVEKTTLKAELEKLESKFHSGNSLPRMLAISNFHLLINLHSF